MAAGSYYPLLPAPPHGLETEDQQLLARHRVVRLHLSH